MQQFMVVFGLAIFVEGIVEYLGVPLPSKAKPYAAAALAVLACLGFGADLFKLVGLNALYPHVGEVATGLIIGRGSNYLNDIWSRINLVKPPVMGLQAAMERTEEGYTAVAPAPSWVAGSQGSWGDPFEGVAQGHPGAVRSKEGKGPLHHTAIKRAIRPETEEELAAMAERAEEEPEDLPPRNSRIYGAEEPHG